MSDLPQRQAPPVYQPPPTFTWTGFYTGSTVEETAANAASMTQWLAPVTFTQPVAQRYYYGAAVMNLGKGTVYLETAYSDDYTGKTVAQSDTYQAYTVGFFGQLSAPTPLTTINTSDNGSNPVLAQTELTYGFTPFAGPSTLTDYVAVWIDENPAGGTVGVQTAVYNTATSAVTTGPSFEFTDSVVTNSVRAATIENDNVLVEVEETYNGSVFGSFDILNAGGDAVVSGGSGFQYSDGLAHVSSIGRWNAYYYAQYVEVWSDTSGSVSTVGNNKESKLAFFRYIADELKDKLSIRPDDIMINMVFVDREDWSFGNGEPWN